jgi:hypothetical protein
MGNQIGQQVGRPTKNPNFAHRWLQKWIGAKKTTGGTTEQEIAVDLSPQAKENLI